MFFKLMSLYMSNVLTRLNYMLLYYNYFTRSLYFLFYMKYKFLYINILSCKLNIMVRRKLIIKSRIGTILVGYGAYTSCRSYLYSYNNYRLRFLAHLVFESMRRSSISYLLCLPQILRYKFNFIGGKKEIASVLNVRFVNPLTLYIY